MMGGSIGESYLAVTSMRMKILMGVLHEYQDTKTDNDKSSVILGVILPTNYGDDVMCKMLHNNQFHPDMIELHG
jgi:hypothetical protein